MAETQSAETISMPEALSVLGRQLGEYGDWRDQLLRDIRSYKDWIEREGLGEPEDELRIFELIESLRSDKLSVALVAEFSRGKTELINAMFFAGCKQRLLPSTAGRTTMCPTEIQYDLDREPCIMLLPIETRKSATTIIEYKRAPVNWTILPLEIDNPQKMAETLREIVRTQRVSVREARELGLYEEDPDNPDPQDGVEVPVWRHAIINYPHPLLERGLVILDTPGLNALGQEPELTLSMLPSAHAVLFVLAADTGVTRTDLEVWKNHVCVSSRRRGKRCVAVLNKIDTLWDELQADDSVASAIAHQAEEASRILGITTDNVFPVSAQKALLGRVKNDDQLVGRSGLMLLEEKISTDLVDAKRRIVRERIISEIGAMMQSTLAIINSRLAESRAELEELVSMRGKSEEVLAQMHTRLREHREMYNKEAASFELTRRILSDQVKNLLGHMNMSSFDRLIGEARQTMEKSWTTGGLRTAMATFFDGAAQRMENVSTDAGRLKTTIDTAYEKFHKDHGLPRLKPSSLSLLKYRTEFKRLEVAAEDFRSSARMLVTEQHFVIKKFFISLASHARNVFNECNRETKEWARSILTPIYTQIQEHKVMIERRLDNLEKIRVNHSNLANRVEELKKTVSELDARRAHTQHLMERIYAPVSDPA